MWQCGSWVGKTLAALSRHHRYAEKRRIDAVPFPRQAKNKKNTKKNKKKPQKKQKPNVAHLPVPADPFFFLLLLFFFVSFLFFFP